MSSQKFIFGEKSEQLLNTVADELSGLAHNVIKISPIDFAIVEGFRTEEKQKELYDAGKTKTLNSKHCVGRAIDVVPCLNYRPNFEMINSCCFIVGLFYALAKQNNLKIRVGAIWDGESIENNNFVDLWHIELL
ncbi:hypothetical protein FACS1894152_4110 [Bacilli bacterium]|nr:hypothetical protein FACS1894152_4110 [Bacilli bacterium]